MRNLGHRDLDGAIGEPVDQTSVGDQQKTVDTKTEREKSLGLCHRGLLLVLFEGPTGESLHNIFPLILDLFVEVALGAL